MGAEADIIAYLTSRHLLSADGAGFDHSPVLIAFLVATRADHRHWVTARRERQLTGYEFIATNFAFWPAAAAQHFWRNMPMIGSLSECFTARCRPTKLIYFNHRLPPWPNEDATPRSLELLLGVTSGEHC